MYFKLRRLLSRHWDVISYLFFGVLTTVVNYLVYLPCYNLLGLSAAFSNVIAWAVAVVFAYLTNKPFVFRSHDWSVSTVIPEYLIDCWNWAIQKRPLLTQCQMHVEILPAVTYCEGCGKEYGTVEHGRICPLCGSEKTWLLKGNELNIKEIEVI